MKKQKQKKIRKLKPAMELFCRYFVGVDFNNATRAYARAYGFPMEEWDKLEDMGELRRIKLAEQERWYELKSRYVSCRTLGTGLLANVSTERRVNELLLEKFNEQDVDAEHAFVINQKKDLPSKIAAIREFNKLKGRITDKVKVSGTFSLSEILDDVDKEGK